MPTLKPYIHKRTDVAQNAEFHEKSYAYHVLFSAVDRNHDSKFKKNPLQLQILPSGIPIANKHCWIVSSAVAPPFQKFHQNTILNLPDPDKGILL